MSFCGFSGISTMSMLISAQSSFRSVGAIRSARNSLETEATIYKRSFSYAGDPEKANALSDKAQNLGNSIGRITGDIQTKIKNVNQEATENTTEDSQTDASTDPSKADNNVSKDFQQTVSANSIYDSSGKLILDSLITGNNGGQPGTAVCQHLDRLA